MKQPTEVNLKALKSPQPGRTGTAHALCTHPAFIQHHNIRDKYSFAKQVLCVHCSRRKSLASFLNTKPILSVEHKFLRKTRQHYSGFYTWCFLLQKPSHFVSGLLCTTLGTSPLGTAQFWVWAPSFPCFLRQLMTYLATPSQAYYFFLTKTISFSHQLRWMLLN